MYKLGLNINRENNEGTLVAKCCKLDTLQQKASVKSAVDVVTDMPTTEHPLIPTDISVFVIIATNTT